MQKRMQLTNGSSRSLIAAGSVVCFCKQQQDQQDVTMDNNVITLGVVILGVQPLVS